MTGAVKLNTAGGGSVVVQPASSIASDVTVNVPSQNCTLGIQGPAFSAYASSTTTASNATATKIGFATEEFDTASCYDTTTSRFTPNVAGYYKVESQFTWTTAGPSASGISRCMIYKNGSVLAYTDIQNSTAIGVFGSAQCLVYLNGSTDYVEVYVFQNSGSSQTVNNQQNTTRFGGCLLRAA